MLESKSLTFNAILCARKFRPYDAQTKSADQSPRPITKSPISNCKFTKLQNYEIPQSTVSVTTSACPAPPAAVAET